jgi:hypothetical protein
MLVSLNEIMQLAEERHCAIGAFNTPNLECIRAVIDTAEACNLPVIISHAELHEEVSPLEVIGPVMVLSAKQGKVPVCVHLDHCETLDYMAKALEIGFTGVMYDGSLLPYEENVANTVKAVAMARPTALAWKPKSASLPREKAVWAKTPEALCTPTRSLPQNLCAKPESTCLRPALVRRTAFTRQSRCWICSVWPSSRKRPVCPL